MSSAAAATAYSRRTSPGESPILSPRQRKSNLSASRGSGGSSFLTAPPMSPRSPRSPRSSNNTSKSPRLKHQSSSISEEVHDSEFGGGGGGGGTDGSSKGGSSRRRSRPKLAETRRDSYLQRSFRLLEEPRGQRQFEATVIFKEYCLRNDKERMNVDQLKPYAARVFNTRESSLDEAPFNLVLDEAIKKSEDEPEGILHISAVVLAVSKYGDYAKHCKEIEKLFHDVDWSKDGKLQRQELREMIQIYESNQTRSTDFVKNVLLFVTEDDINHILNLADKNHDGDIDLSEVVLAIDIWEELARSKLADFDKLHCQKCKCTIS